MTAYEPMPRRIRLREKTGVDGLAYVHSDGPDSRFDGIFLVEVGRWEAHRSAAIVAGGIASLFGDRKSRYRPTRCGAPVLIKFRAAASGRKPRRRILFGAEQFRYQESEPKNPFGFDCRLRRTRRLRSTAGAERNEATMRRRRNHGRSVMAMSCPPLPPLA